MEKKLDDKISESTNDGKEHEKMVFNLVFNANSGTENVQEKTGNGFGKMNSTNEPKCLEQSKKKLKLVKKIAKVINPLIYVLYVIFYFIYFIIFFSQ